MSFWKKSLGLQPAAPLPYVTPAMLPANSPALQIQYLGTAGFVVRDRTRTLVLDPYLTRPGLWTSLTAPLVPDAALIQRLIPQADDVLVGHAHHDHILDAPDLCKQTGARLIGSRATRQVGLAAGLPDSQIVATDGREDIASGTWTVRGLPSRHGRIFGRIPFPGDLTSLPPWPPRMSELRHGLVLNWWIDTGALKVVHIDSADFIDDELAGHRADVVCLCAIGRQARPHYVRDVVRHLQPRWIIPCHWDTMITPIDAAPDLMPGIDLPGFIDEITAAGVTALLTPLLGHQHFPR